MDSQGRIFTGKDLQNLNDEVIKNLIEIPNNEIKKVSSMSRKQRRLWYKNNKKNNNLNWSETNKMLKDK